MRIYYTPIYAVIFLSFFFGWKAFGQESWDLEKCINYAIEHSLAVQSADFNAQRALVNEKFSLHQRYPSLNGNANVGWNFGRTIDPTTNDFITETFFSNRYSINSSVILFDGWRIKNTIAQSRINILAANSDKKQAERDLALDVSLAYLNILFSQENLDNSNAQLELSEKQLEQIDKLIEAGSRPRNDRLDLVAQVTTQEQQIINDKNALDIAMLNLKQQMNLDPGFELTIVPPGDNIVVETDPDIVTFQEVFEKAYRNQPVIEAGEHRLRSAQFDVDLAKANHYPTISLGGSLGTNYSNKGIQIDGTTTERVFSTVYLDDQPVTFGIDQDFPITSKSPYFNQFQDNISYGFGFNVNIPLYNNYNTKANIELAEINVMSQKNLNDQNIQLLKTSVQQALADAKKKKKALEAAQNTVEAQRVAFENAEKRFDLGAINTYDYIQARNQYDSANISMIISKYDYLFKLKLLDFYQGKPLRLE